jgi:hypothetical protein
MHLKTKARIPLASAALAAMLGWIGLPHHEEGGPTRSGQVALPPQMHQPETHAEFKFSNIPAALYAYPASFAVAPPPGSIVISGFAPTIEGVRPVLHPGVA